ncbi:thioesterase II family protein [Streptomyces sp. AJS327]|uniref:thioesterase II family protein n=1 Tax=Streptomyces sp. AJS327 TaxID=2545265 RepID=UPI0015DF50EB|nr:alpha/beta fold hydrolase [Streptomyces sp. AJS327]
MTTPTDHTTLTRWVAGLATTRPPGATLPLVCVPHAGGGTATYQTWASTLPEEVTPWPLRLPGRESRRAEPRPLRMEDVVDPAAAALAPHLTEPFALYGHSLGALIAYELAHALRDRFGLEADLLAVSARRAPHLAPSGPPVHHLPDAELVTAVERTYQGMPTAILEDPEILSVYLPVLRADLTVLETYRHRQRPRLRCPVTVFGARDDTTVAESELAAWSDLSAGPTTLRQRDDGGHFFPQSHRTWLTGHLSQDLLRLSVP